MAYTLNQAKERPEGMKIKADKILQQTINTFTDIGSNFNSPQSVIDNTQVEESMRTEMH